MIMGVEAFFPAHYPWQRLLRNIARNFEEEEDMVRVVQVIKSGSTYELQISGSEALETMKNGFLVGVHVNEGEDEEDTTITVHLFVGYQYLQEYGYTFITQDVDYFICSSLEDKPVFE